MQCLIYVSAACLRTGPPDLGGILAQSERNNVRSNVTGVLFYADGNFLQMLEGTAEAVDTTYQRICADPRHSGILKLLHFDITYRQFPSWAMALRRLNDLPPEYQREFGRTLTRWRLRPFGDGVSTEVRLLAESFTRTM